MCSCIPFSTEKGMQELGLEPGTSSPLAEHRPTRLRARLPVYGRLSLIPYARPPEALGERLPCSNPRPLGHQGVFRTTQPRSKSGCRFGSL